MNPRAIHLAAAVAAAATLLTACGYPDPNSSNGPVATTQVTTPTPVAGADKFNEGAGQTPVKFPDGLQILDLVIGQGATVPKGATVRVNYTGWLASNGTQFDSSRDAGRQPLCAILTSTTQQSGDCTPVIPGWNEGVPGMKVGGRRKLIIPSSLAYGDQGSPPVIPGGATLVFTVEVLSIEPTPTPSPTPSATATPTHTPTASPTK